MHNTVCETTNLRTNYLVAQVVERKQRFSFVFWAASLERLQGQIYKQLLDKSSCYLINRPCPKNFQVTTCTFAYIYIYIYNYNKSLSVSQSLLLVSYRISDTSNKKHIAKQIERQRTSFFSNWRTRVKSQMQLGFQSI